MVVKRGWIGLLVATGVIASVWLGVLPRVAQFEPVARDMQFLESRGIDPSARYYTDQPIGWRNAQAIEDKVKAEPQAFWGR